MQVDFDHILEENKDRIYRLCRIYAVVPLEPDDLFQEVVLQLWRSLDSFQGKAHVNTWVYRVALNVCYRYKLRLNKKEERTTSLDSITFTHAAPSQETNEERYQLLRHCMTQLPDADQSLLVLYLEDIAYREIGEILGLSENHVAVKMKRIREKLLKCMTQQHK